MNARKGSSEPQIQLEKHITVCCLLLLWELLGSHSDSAHHINLSVLASKQKVCLGPLLGGFM